MSAALLIALPVFPSSRLPAQSITLVGHLLRARERDTTALGGLWVVAHEVGERRQGPIDSMRSDATGRFHFQVPRPDSGTVYVVSTRYQGIGYFSEPVQPGRTEPLTLVVFDTSVAGPPLSVGIRHVVITRGDQGQKRVLDIFQVVNPGRATRVGRDSATSVWSASLPAGATGPQPGESDVPASALRFQPGRVDVVAPFPPGLKQVVITYDLVRSARSLVVPIDQPTERLEVLVEDSTATASPDLTVEEPVSIESRAFRRWSADSLRAGATPTLTFSTAPTDPRRYTWIAALGVALALAAGAALALRRRPRAALASHEAPDGSAPGGLDAESDERLVAQIAALDDKFGGHEAETPPERWAAYRQRRAELKAALARRVARP